MIGVVIAVYVNRDQIREKVTALRGGAPAGEEAAPAEPGAVDGAPPGPRGAATPHPAQEAQAEAARLYPGLRIPGSPLNKKFVALYNEAKATNPALLATPDWPLTLADQAIVSVGGSPLPRSTPAPTSGPKPLPGSALDQRPPKHH